MGNGIYDNNKRSIWAKWDRDENFIVSCCNDESLIQPFVLVVEPVYEGLNNPSEYAYFFCEKDAELFCRCLFSNNFDIDRVLDDYTELSNCESII
jgi:hypothetical protein